MTPSAQSENLASSTPARVWFSGGSLQARYDGGHVRHLEPEKALAEREFWAARCAELGPDTIDGQHAAGRYIELTGALDKLDHWNRIAGKPSPYPNERAEVARRFAACPELNGERS